MIWYDISIFRYICFEVYGLRMIGKKKYLFWEKKGIFFIGKEVFNGFSFG